MVLTLLGIRSSFEFAWRPQVSVLTKFLRSKEGEVSQRKGCTFKAQISHAGKPPKKLDKQS